MIEILRLRAYKQGILTDTIGFCLFEKHDEGYFTVVAMDIEMHKLGEGVEPEPSFSLSLDACQVLIDSLWDVGIRPTEGKGSAGQLKATEYHLEDMRKLTFKNRVEI